MKATTMLVVLVGLGCSSAETETKTAAQGAQAPELAQVEPPGCQALKERLCQRLEPKLVKLDPSRAETGCSLEALPCKEAAEALELLERGGGDLEAWRRLERARAKLK